MREYCRVAGSGTGTPATTQAGVPEYRDPGHGFHELCRVNVLAGSLLTVGDLEALKELIEAFGLQPVVVPDLADSLDGHLGDEEFNPLTYGGVSVAEIETLGEADATLVVGRSMDKCGRSAAAAHRRSRLSFRPSVRAGADRRR